MTKKEQLLQQYSDYLRMRNYSESTYKAYMGSVRNFWLWCDGQKKSNPHFDKTNAVQGYLAYRMFERKMDYATVNGDYSALQWFYKYVLNREWNIKKLVRPIRPKRLPRFITPEQFNALLRATTYRKHQMMFLFYYSTGMRLSELRNLKWEDIHFDEDIIMIRNGKGGKDRIVILQTEMKALLLDYRQEQHPNQILVFEGNRVGIAIAPRSVQHAFRYARDKAGLPEWVTTHTLRHSFATTALKNKTDLLTLKELLGHKKLETTAQYLHLDTNFLKQSYNTLSNQCLSQAIQAVQNVRKTPIAQVDSPPCLDKRRRRNTNKSCAENRPDSSLLR